MLDPVFDCADRVSFGETAVARDVPDEGRVDRGLEGDWGVGVGVGRPAPCPLATIGPLLGNSTDPMMISVATKGSLYAARFIFTSL